MAAVGLGRGKTLMRPQRLERLPPDPRGEAPATKVAAPGGVQKNKNPLRDRPFGISHGLGQAPTWNRRAQSVGGGSPVPSIACMGLLTRRRKGSESCQELPKNESDATYSAVYNVTPFEDQLRGLPPRIVKDLSAPDGALRVGRPGRHDPGKASVPPPSEPGGSPNYRELAITSRESVRRTQPPE
jgi:hypothetical protein